MLKRAQWWWKSYVNGEKKPVNSLTPSKKQRDEKVLTERVPITGTPLHSVMNDGKYYLIMGKHRMNTMEYKSHEDVITYVEQNEMNVILQMIFIVYHDLQHAEK